MQHVSDTIARRAEGLALTQAEVTRYSRHLLLPEVGKDGQRRLKAARVLVVGAGGLGSPVALYLTAAGVGTIGIVEFDTVDSSNLQRQVLFSESDAGQSKLDAAVKRLRELNSFVTIVPHETRLDSSNVEGLFAGYDIVVDGTDNFPTRYLANDACVFAHKPYVYGSIFRFDGQASVFYAPHGPCYRCLFPSPPPEGQVPSCAEGGVLGVLPAQIGSIQANEVLKLILGRGRSLLGRLMTLDALDMRVDEFKIGRDPTCPVCSADATIKTLATSVTSCEVTPAVSTGEAPVPEIDVAALHAMRARREPHVLLDVRSPQEVAVCRIEGSVLIPLPQLESRLGELAKDQRVIVHCKSGARSARAVETLRRHGFSRAESLRGGILAWIDAYAPELSRY